MKSADQPSRAKRGRFMHPRVRRRRLARTLLDPEEASQEDDDEVEIGCGDEKPVEA
jgi:hypothetical protein